MESQCNREREASFKFCVCGESNEFGVVCYGKGKQYLHLELFNSLLQTEVLHLWVKERLDL